MGTIKISSREMSCIKRNAKNIAADVVKAQKIEEKILSLQEELTDCKERIKAMDAGTLVITKGKAGSMDVVDRVTKVVGVDENGKDLKQTDYVVKSNIPYNEDAKAYILTFDDEPTQVMGDIPEINFENQ